LSTRSIRFDSGVSQAAAAASTNKRKSRRDSGEASAREISPAITRQRDGNAVEEAACAWRCRTQTRVLGGKSPPGVRALRDRSRVTRNDQGVATRGSTTDYDIARDWTK